VLRLDRTAGCVVGHSHYYLFGLVNEISGRADVSRTGLRVNGTERAGAAGPGGPTEVGYGRTRIATGRCGPARAETAREPERAGAGVDVGDCRSRT
jgi:hypothetical protein